MTMVVGRHGVQVGWYIAAGNEAEINWIRDYESLIYLVEV